MTTMTIDWQAFTPWTSVAGGALIGGAAALLMLLVGRIAGISGVLAGALAGLRNPSAGDLGWRLAFLAGMVAAPLVLAAAGAPLVVHLDAGLPALVVAGLLVGVGTRMGSGCTSGHGVCGIARGSPRSLAAVPAFLAAGMVTAVVIRHLA